MDNGILAMIQKQIGYRFNNSDLLKQAFVRRSYSKENGGENNEILEFIGDKALDFIIVKKLSETYGFFAEEYENYDSREDFNEFISQHSEGTLTEIKKKLVCREMLASRIRVFGFQYELITGKSDREQNIHERESVQEDLFEAIVGAVALDSNWNIDALTTVVDLMLEPNYYLENGFNEEENYVVLLQQWYQKKHNRIPIYEFKRIDFPIWCDKAEIGDSDCWLSLYPLENGFRAVGHTKSKARMAVAKKAYEYLKENGLLYDWIDEVGEPEMDRAINQLQELYQKGFIGEPRYEFNETYDKNGNPRWHGICLVDGHTKRWFDSNSSKKQVKKSIAYAMLCDILNREDDDET